MRLFIAVNIPDEVKAEIAALQDRLRRVPADVRWVNPGQAHLTLKFLGEVEDGALDKISGAVRRAAGGAAPFEIAFSALGAFPSLQRPRVLWAGISRGAEELLRLAGGIEDALFAAGYARDTRPFAAHLTIGRVRSPQNLAALAKRIAAGADFEAGPFRVTHVDIMRSRLNPRGAQHECLHSVNL